MDFNKLFSKFQNQRQRIELKFHRISNSKRRQQYPWSLNKSVLKEIEANRRTTRVVRVLAIQPLSMWLLCMSNLLLSGNASNLQPFKRGAQFGTELLNYTLIWQVRSRWFSLLTDWRPLAYKTQFAEKTFQCTPFQSVLCHQQCPLTTLHATCLYK